MNRGFSIKEVADIVLNGAFDVTEEIVDAGRKAYCNLHQNHPAWTVARNFSDRSIILRAIDRMCDDGNYTPPPEPTPPYSGGQCDALYHAFGTYTSKNLSSCNQIAYWRTSQALNATQVQSFIPTDNNQTSWSIPLINGGSGGLRPVNQAFYDSRNLNNESTFAITYRAPSATCPNVNQPVYGHSLQLTEVLRQDGQPDNCGDPPAEYPPEPPPVDGDLNQTINITNNAGDSYDYDVTINRDENNTINFPPTIVINDVSVTMDVTGITIISNNNTNKPSGGGSGGVAEDEPVESKDENEGKELVVEIGAIEEDVTQLYGVIVQFSSIPVNEKNVTGYAGPRIIYGGWVQFKIGANYLQRIYMNYDNGYFLAPEGATGYAVSLKTGYNATIFKAYYQDI